MTDNLTTSSKFLFMQFVLGPDDLTKSNLTLSSRSLRWSVLRQRILPNREPRAHLLLPARIPASEQPVRGCRRVRAAQHLPLFGRLQEHARIFHLRLPGGPRGRPLQGRVQASRRVRQRPRLPVCLSLPRGPLHRPLRWLLRHQRSLLRREPSGQ